MYRNTKRNLVKREQILASKGITTRTKSDSASPTAASADSNNDETEALLGEKTIE